eukprot:Nk52_evm1s707 gene=Nk52_evmTU1s707
MSSSNPNNNTDGLIEIRVKHGESEIVKNVRRNLPLIDLKRQCFPMAFEEYKPVRLIFGGFLLDQDQAGLDYYGITDGSVLHASISEIPQPPSSSGLDPGASSSSSSSFYQGGPGKHLNAMVAVILIALWGFFFLHRDSELFFNTRNTVMFVLVTVMAVYCLYKCR